MEQDRFRLAAGLATVAAVVLLLLAFAGTQTQTILSKVGAAIPPGDAGNGGQTDTSGGSASGSAAGSTAAPGEQVAAVVPSTLLVIRSGSLTLETPGITPTVSAASGLVAAGGGFVAGSRETGTGIGANAVVDYRIPAAAWESTLGGLRGLGTVRDQTIKSEEVTGTVADLGARIANLRATEAALQATMAKAVQIADVLDVQKQLTDTQGQIEQLTAQQAGLKDRAAFGNLTITSRLPPVAATPAPTARPPLWDPGADAEQATAKLVRIGQKAGTAGIWFAIIGVPILLAIAIVIAVGWAGYRLATRRSRQAV